MRLLLSIVFVSLLIPLAAGAQAPKQVEVIDEPLAVEVAEPLAVEVVNPAPACEPLRWQLVGYSEIRGGGNTFRVMEQNRVCAAEFPGRRACTSAEILDTVNPIPTGPDFPGAWVRPVIQLIALGDSMDVSGVVNAGQNFNCIATNNGLVMQSDESFAIASCSSVLPVAQTRGSLASNQVNLTECLLSDIAENAASFSYQQTLKNYNELPLSELFSKNGDHITSCTNVVSLPETVIALSTLRFPPSPPFFQHTSLTLSIY